MRTPIHEAEVAIVGLVRNCSRSLASEIATLASAARCFQRVQFLVIESDSTDDTLDVLRALKRDVLGFEFVALGRLDDKHPERTDRIAVCRNRYLDELTQNARYAKIDYVLVADLDGVNADLTADSLRTCWDPDVRWDVCGANQGDRYYDIWALRHPDWCPTDCHRQFRALEPRFGRAQAHRLAIQSRKMHLDPRSDWLEVDSAFGGLAIYRREALLAGRYRGLDDRGEPICEHVLLHAELRERGFRIFINPALINARYAPHTGRKPLHVRLRRRIESVGDRVRSRWLGS